MSPEFMLKITAKNLASAGFAEVARDISTVEGRAKLAQTAIGGIGSAGKATIAALGFSGPIASVITLGAAIHGTRAALEQFSKIADMSTAAGVNAEFFQGIAYQAKLSGVEIDAVATSLATFAKNAGMAEEGRGKMVGAFNALSPGLLQTVNAAGDMETKFLAVVDAIAKAKDNAQAAAIATSAFGDQGVRLVDALRGGSTELGRMMQKAREAGLIVDNELIAKADTLGDRWDTTSQILDLKVKRALLNLAPIMDSLVSKAVDLTDYIAKLGGDKVPMNIPSWGDQAPQHLGDVLRGLAYPEASVGGLPRRYSESTYGFDFGSIFNSGTNANVAAMSAPAGSALGSSWGSGWSSGAFQSSTLPATPSASGGIASAFTAATESIDPFAARIKELDPVLSKLHDPIMSMMDDLTDLGTMYANGAISANTYGEAVTRTYSNVAGEAFGMAAQVTGALSQMFKGNKTFAVANAVLQGLSGVSYAIGSAPFPMNLINAGVVGAQAAANVAAIMSTSETSTSMPSIGSSAGSSSASTGAAAAAPQQAIQIHLQGASVYSSDQVEQMLVQMAKVMGDGGGRQLIEVIKQQ